MATRPHPPAPEGNRAESGPQPQPERHEPRLRDPGLGSLSRRDWWAILKRAARETLDDNMPMVASALAYSSFLAIPAALLLATGLFTLLAGPDAITTLMDRFSAVAPAEIATLLDGSLRRLSEQQGASLAMTIVGFVLALWTATGAMTSLMTGLNMAYEVEDTRGFVRKRATAVAMVMCALVAFALVFLLLVLGPQLTRFVQSELGFGWISWVSWLAQWPILIGGLLLAFATLLYLGPNVRHPRWQFVTPGSLVAVAVWLVASAGFAVYVSMFGSYNKTWGSLAAVIVMLVWLWLTGLALLFGAEVNAEAERSRQLRRGEPAEQRLQLEPRA
jgi:membrane protein